MEIGPVVADLLVTDRRTEVQGDMTRQDSRFSQFCERA
jgi:hypothetical protein